MMSLLSIDTSAEQGTTVMRLSGSAGLATIAALEREVTRLSALQHSLLILDLSALEGIASLAVSQFVLLHRAVQNRGGVVRIGGCGENVRGVLIRCKIDSVIPIFESIDEAMHARG